MKLVAVATIYDERLTFSREIEPKLEMTDEDIIQFMADAEGNNEPLDSVVLVTIEEDGSVFTEELIG